MKGRTTLRVTLATVALVVASAVFATWTFVPLAMTVDQLPGTVDQVTNLEYQFAELKQTLSAGSVVGYVSDVPEPQFFYLTQYVLAPVIVARNTDHRLVVGFFADPRRIGQVAIDRRLTLIRSFEGTRVALLRNEAK